MPLTLDKLKKLHDKAFNANQLTRERGSDDLMFYWITQWDDQFLSDVNLSYRGEFNVIRKAGRDILSGMSLNPVQPDFHPKDESRADDAELMDGFYRAIDRKLESQEAYDSAKQDQVVCGFGAWELRTVYKTNAVGDERQTIERRYIPEANNTVFFDPNSNSLDKREAFYVSCLKAYSKDGYEELRKDLTGEDKDSITWESFSSPAQSYSFVWGGKDSEIYVSTFYHKEKVKDKVLALEDPLGQPLIVRESQIDEVMDDLIDANFTIVGEKEITRFRVTKYIASGSEILNGEIDEETGERSGEVIPGEYLPVVPIYGEHVSQIEGNEHWEGVTRLAKDPQRLRNFQMSYLADIVSRSPRPKPIFYPAQVKGFESMYQNAGADNNYPYYLINPTDPQGNPLPNGNVGELPEQRIPQGLPMLLDYSRQAVEDVANPGVPQNIADPDLSGKAVMALQQKIDNQYYVYQQHSKYAKRLDAEIFASIASEIMDIPQKITVATRDGQTKQVDIMRVIIDRETGKTKTLNDLTNMEFDVYADIGPTYQNQKEQTVDRLTALYQSMPDGSAERQLTLLKLLELLPGVEMDDLRDHARNQLILQGIRQPETEEEFKMLQAAQSKPTQPDANMVLAMAEQEKARADQMEVQRKAQKDFADAQNQSAELLLKEKDLNIKQADAQIKAAKAGVDIRKTLSETESINIENQSKKIERIRLFTPQSY